MVSVRRMAQDTKPARLLRVVLKNEKDASDSHCLWVLAASQVPPCDQELPIRRGAEMRLEKATILTEFGTENAENY
jgi:hypothetical protein